MAIPLITKNRVIGVINIEARDPDYFTDEHKRLLTLIGSRMAAGIVLAQATDLPTRIAQVSNRAADTRPRGIRNGAARPQAQQRPSAARSVVRIRIRG